MQIMYNRQYWNEHWVLPLCQQGREITLRIRDQNELSSGHLGRVTVNVSELLRSSLTGEQIKGSFNTYIFNIT